MGEEIVDDDLISLNFQGQNPKNTLQRHLDQSRGHSTPNIQTVTTEVAVIMFDDRWKSTDGKEKIQKWFATHVRTQENIKLQKWFDCEHRDEAIWKAAAKTQLLLAKQMATCRDDVTKPPYTISQLSYVKFKEWLKKYFAKQKAEQKKQQKTDVHQAALAEQVAASTLTCKRCSCTCTITGSGRGLKHVKPCHLHKNSPVISQLFLKLYQGNFLEYCAHCMVQCGYCGCLSLRSTTMIGCFDSCTLLCREGHSKDQVDFRIRKRTTPCTDWETTLPGNQFELAKCCVECDATRNAKQRQAYHKRTHAAAMVPSPLVGPPGVSTPSAAVSVVQHVAPLPAPRSHQSTFISASDLRVATHYMQWKEVTSNKKKRERLEQIAISEQVLIERVEHLFKKLCPKYYRNAQKQTAT